MEMKIQVPEQIVVVSEKATRQLRLESCIGQEEIKGYLQAVKIGYEIEKLQKTGICDTK